MVVGSTLSLCSSDLPQIEVTFDIDANGIMNVSAQDKGTGKQMQITIQASGGLSDEEIDQMMKEAEENAEADKQKRELVEARNQAEGLIHATEKSLEEHGDKVDQGTRDGITAAIAALNEVLEGEDAAAIQEKSQALAEASMKLGEAIYKEQAEAANAEGGPDMEDAMAEADDGVVDAEFTDVTEDDDKKAS